MSECLGDRLEHSISVYTNQSKSCISYKYLCNFCISGTNESNIHLKQLVYLHPKTWKYGGSVFGIEVAGGAQTV